MKFNQDTSINMPQVQATQDIIQREKQKTANELIDTIGGSQDVLIRVTTAFPFALFPDTITIDRTKLTITHRDFFRLGESLSINIEDILNVTAGVGPLFGTIKLSTRFFDALKPYVVRHLTRGDTLRIKRILQGYIIAKQKKVDSSALSTRELAKLLDELGKVAPAEIV